MHRREKLFIRGAWVEPAGSAQIEVTSPHTEQVVARVPEATDEDVARAVEAARQAFDSGPAGVVGAITPWNIPLMLELMKVAPALGAGCCVVLKPAAEAPLDSFVLAEIAEEAGLPAGVLNVVPGRAATGEALVRHPGVD